MTQHYAMLQRNLLYAGITRDNYLVVLVGQKNVVAIAVRNVSGQRRWSKLDEWLSPTMSLYQPALEDQAEAVARQRRSLWLRRACVKLKLSPLGNNLKNAGGWQA